jgi:hypothetical protein
MGAGDPGERFVACGFGALMIRRLENSFQIVEVVLNPGGGGCVIRRFVWDLYREVAMAQEASSEGAKQAVDHDELADEALIASMSGDAGVESSERRNLASQRIRGEPLGARLDTFWASQGALQRSFSPAERNIVAFWRFTTAGEEPLLRYLVRGICTFVVVAMVVVAAPYILPESKRGQGEFVLMLAAVVYAARFSNYEFKDFSAAFRALPLTTAQWLWPRIKFQWLRLCMLLPVGSTILALLLWHMEKPGDEIVQWIIGIVAIHLLLVPLSQMMAYNEGSRDRWFRLASIWFVAKMLASMLLLLLGGILLIAWPWPASLTGLLISIAAMSMMWLWICRWHDRGPVDQPSEMP